MRAIQNLLILSFLICSCKNIESNQIRPENKIVVDTIIINIKGSLEQTIFYKKNYYCFFSEESPYSSMGELHFYIISEDGKIKREVFVPNEMQNFYLDLHIRNDSILSKDYYDHQTYYLDQKIYKWVEIKKTDDRVFEDERFYVTFLDFGEWGGTIWFKDKKTGNEYEIASSDPIINKFNGNYYVTTGSKVLVIEDPLKLKICESNSKYKIVESAEWHMGSQFTKGADTIFVYYASKENSKFYIATAFVLDNQLKYLCVDSNIVFIANIESGKIIATDTIGYNILVYRDNNTYRCNLYQNKSQLLHFMSKDEEVFGFILIDEKSVKVHYVRNLDTAKFLGTHNADLAFDKLFNYVTENLGNLSLKQIESYESKLGATDATPRHEMSIGEDLYPNKNGFVLESPKVYKKIEDSILTSLTNYYYTKRDSSVKVFYCEWRTTHENAYRMYASENEATQKISFQKKFEVVKKCIIDKYGEPTSINETKNGRSFTWQRDNLLQIELFCSDFEIYRNIDILIFKE